MKKTIEDFRKDYRNVTGKEPAIRWNKRTLAKKTLDAKILKQGHDALEKSRKTASDDSMFQDVKPDFESLAADTQKSIHVEAVVEQPTEEGRGGPRPGAGRPVGQTDERARIERLLSLEKPDLGVLKFVQGMNLVLARFSPVPFTKEQCESIALGFTLPLYYWFPSVEGAANKWTLHLQSLEYIGRPVSERAVRLSQLTQTPIKEQEHGKEESSKEESKPIEAVKGPAAERRAQTKKRPARSRSNKK